MKLRSLFEMKEIEVKLQEILLEGMIKIPPTTLMSIIKCVQAAIDHGSDGKPIEGTVKQTKTLLVFKIPFAVHELPASYIKKAAKQPDITLVLNTNRNFRSLSEYWVPPKHEIHLGIKGLTEITSELKSIIEHELMHAVQVCCLKNLHVSQARPFVLEPSFTSYLDPENKNKYLVSGIEKLPQLHLVVEVFLRTYPNYSNDDLRNFISKNKYFLAIKKHKPGQYQKIVSSFITLVKKQQDK